MFLVQQGREIFAPLSRHNGALVEIIIKAGCCQIIFGVDAVEVKMGHGAGAAVIVDDGEGGTADRVGAAQTLSQTAAKGGFAGPQTAGEGDDGPIGEGGSHAASQRHGFLGRMGDEFSHDVTSNTKMQRPTQSRCIQYSINREKVQ